MFPLISCATISSVENLAIQANISVAPWDVLNTGISNTIGTAMFIDAAVIGKAVDFYTFIGAVPKSDSIFISTLMLQDSFRIIFKSK